MGKRETAEYDLLVEKRQKIEKNYKRNLVIQDDVKEYHRQSF